MGGMGSLAPLCYECADARCADWRNAATTQLPRTRRRSFDWL